MTTLKIGIVEDDLIIAEAIAEMLLESGYRISGPATRYSEAIAMIEDESPDLLLLDVNIRGKLDGIEVARTIRQSWNLPYIFLTANTDYDTIARAKEVAPAAFLAKPITKAQLFAAIEIAAASWNAGPVIPLQAIQKAEGNPGYLFVKDGYNFRRVQYRDIIFAESEQNYIRLYLADGSRPLVRSTISEFEERITGCGLLRVHRSYFVQPAKVEKVLPDSLLAAGHTIPISRAYRSALVAALGIG